MIGSDQLQSVLGVHSAEELVRTFGSPLYVYREEIIRERYKQLLNCFPYKKTRVLYACKANTNLHILKVLLSEGCQIDAVSPGEVYSAIKAGFKGEHILYTGDNMSEEDIDFALTNNCLLNCGSLSTLEKVCKKFQNNNIQSTNVVCIRVNPGIGDGHHDHVITGGPQSKFGIYHTYYAEALEIAQKYNVKIIGIHQHIGSNILDADKYAKSINNILNIAKQFPDLEFIDIGGGFGIPYKPNETPLDLNELGNKITLTYQQFCLEYGKELELWVEPGRFLVAESGILLANVTCIKNNLEYKYVGINSGFNHLIRPTMYNSYHEIINTNNTHSQQLEKVNVVGNICESGDILAKDRILPLIHEGDLLAIMNTGAYGFSMASNYNLRPLPAEILLTSDQTKLIRKKQTLEELLQNIT